MKEKETLDVVVTVRFPTALINWIDAHVEQGIYPSRADAIRGIIEVMNKFKSVSNEVLQAMLAIYALFLEEPIELLFYLTVRGSFSMADKEQRMKMGLAMFDNLLKGAENMTDTDPKKLSNALFELKKAINEFAANPDDRMSKVGNVILNVMGSSSPAQDMSNVTQEQEA